MLSARLAPYRRALERVGATLRANRGGPSDRELIDELQKRLFGAEVIEALNKAKEARARAESEPDPPTLDFGEASGPTGSAKCEVRSAESAGGSGEGPECPELSHQTSP
jgi:hypothetical protein